MKFHLELSVKIELQSVPVSFTHQIIQFKITRAGSNGPHEPRTIKVPPIYHQLTVKSRLRNLLARLLI